ncbi:hydroxymethylbilane synthase [Nocardiopsis sp. FR26]|uniref:hydroxymethylbilane synthase n=1 Tax=Nocardiopsis sp. FR26 TaxID=2605987 RepID=UPI0013585152|nr:hydroxymethylbilane synthase [Nocardiopsis sp. FR26]
MSENTLLIGSRGSHLAKAMVREFLAPLRTTHPDLTFKQRTIMTSGDKDRVSSLRALGKSLTSIFATQVEEALLRGDVDIAVHSLKDLPTTPTPGTLLAITPRREDPRDALTGTPFDQLPHGARIGTSSARRVAQLTHLRPDITTVPIRGNVPPRLRKAREMGLAGCLLASSGLRRLGLADEIGTDLDPDLYPPSPAQGILGIQIREADRHLIDLLAPLHDATAHAEATAERTLLAELHGGCSVPVGALARVTGDRLHLDAQVTAVDGTRAIRADTTGPADHAAELGKHLAHTLLDQGAEELLSQVRNTPPTT